MAVIYLDYAATSWPKPPEVLAAMVDVLETAGGNPGRSGHRLSIAAGRVLNATREAVADCFHVSDPLRVVFTPNVTYALNIGLHALLQPGDRVVTTGIEHNSVMRPLREMAKCGLDVVVVPCGPDGSLDLAALRQAVTPGTRLVVATHANNVVGTILPAAEMAAIAHAAGALFMLDAAQTAGVLPIDLPTLDVDLFAFTGHKGLHGPPGSGGLILAESVDVDQLRPVFAGGTGSRSEREEQPEILPDKFEVGTPNSVGIAGLGAGVRFVLARGIDAIREHELALTRLLCEGLASIPGLQVYGPACAKDRTATVSITMEGRRVSDIGWRLDDEFGILTRVGLHCSPATHRTIGTFPEGTVRLAPGLATTREDILATIDALAQISRS
ncbi:MAG: aminotransferase class V-fold PLP-dependent enzyme [Anaerolineales bacterium]